MDQICYVKTDKNGELEFEEIREKHNYRWTKTEITYQLQKDSEDIPGKYMERRAVQLALTSWGMEAPLTFKEVKNNPDIFINFVSSENDPWLENRRGVLAYAYYPGTSKQGKIVFNEDYIWSLDGKPVNAHEIYPERYSYGTKTSFKTYNMLHVLIHEIGHSLGLEHDKDNYTAVMYPYYNGITSLHVNDKKRIKHKYGERTWRSIIIYRISKMMLFYHIRRLR